MNELPQFFQEPTIARDVLVAVLGLCVGSFINVAALRSLQEKNWVWPPSHCTHCEHRLGFMDLIPVVSWFLLNGKCRYCQKQISWQYPVVELLTAFSFVVLLHYFGPNLEAVGMIVFTCVLIAICVTDFREKLIPHEITYPAIILGLIYTGICAAMSIQGDVIQRINHDLTGSLIGIAISYMLFDFIAFYGGLWYMWRHKPNVEDEVPPPENPEDIEMLYGIKFDTFPVQQEEDIEVMGGGDAVLGAVIAAWLGLSRWGVALVVGFLLGTVLGAVYLGIELKKQNMLHKAYVPAAIGAGSALLLAELMLYFCASLSQNLGSSPLQTFLTMPWWQIGSAAILCGALLGVVKAGSSISKPFPFGPALAGGALVAMFYDPFTSSPGGA